MPKGKGIKRERDDDIEINNATDLMNYLQPTYNFTDNPSPGEDLVARMDAIKVQEEIVTQIQAIVNDGPPIKWGSYTNPVTGKKTNFTNRVASTNITNALSRLDTLFNDTESQNLSQLSLAATSVAPGDGERRGDGNCYIQAINIGQGDCTAIATPKGRLILVDMGSDSMTDIKLDWPPSGPPTNNQVLNKKVLPILLGDLRREIFLGTTKLVHMLVLSHTDGDHHNKLFQLGLNMKFGRVYFSGSAISGYYPTSNYLEGRAARGGLKKVDLKQVTGTETLTKTVNGITPPTRSVSQSPNNFDNEYVDSTTGAIVLYEEDNGFKISVLSSNVEGVMFPAGFKGKKVWITDDAVIKTNSKEQQLKLNATDANKKSLVVLVEFNGKRTVITGDATAVTEYFMATQAGYTAKLDGLAVYRLPHHASPTSSAMVMVNKLTNLNMLIGSVSGKWTVLHRLPKSAIFQLYSPVSPKPTRQIWSFDTGPSGAKKMVAFSNFTVGTGSNGTAILKFLKP